MESKYCFLGEVTDPDFRLPAGRQVRILKVDFFTMSGGNIETTSTGKITLVQWFLDCIFPKECLLCQQEGGYWCSECQSRAYIRYAPRCFGCSKNNEASGLCRDCQPRYAFDGIRIAADYEEEIVGSLIRTFKYKFVRSLASDLSMFIKKEIEIFLKQSHVGYSIDHSFFSAVVIGVPLSQRRRKWREFNQAELLAEHIANYCNLEFNNTILKRQHRKPQAKLNSSQRLKNLVDSFYLTGTAPSIVILVDDVVTTGATLHEAARALKDAGTTEVWSFVVAKG